MVGCKVAVYSIVFTALKVTAQLLWGCVIAFGTGRVPSAAALACLAPLIHLAALLNLMHYCHHIMVIASQSLNQRASRADVLVPLDCRIWPCLCWTQRNDSSIC